MSSDDEWNREPLSPADVSRYQVANGVKNGCPFCGSNQWNMLEDEDVRGLVPSVGDSEIRRSERTLPMLALVCQTCSYVWLMARKPVERWINDNPR